MNFYQKHHWDGGKAALGFWPDRIGTLVSMATDSSHRDIGNREADQRLSFCYTDSTVPLLPKSEISSLSSSSVTAQPVLCRTWSETPKTGFLTTRLI